VAGGVNPGKAAFEIIKTAPRGIEPTGRFLDTWLVTRWAVANRAVANRAVANWAVANWAVVAGSIEYNAALGVFFGFEVLDLDFLTFLCCHLSFLSSWVGLLCPWHRRAIDARL